LPDDGEAADIPALKNECLAQDATAFFDRVELVCRKILESIDLAAWPFDLDEFDLPSLSESKVQAKVTLGEITAATSDFFPAVLALSGQFHSGTHSP